MTDELESRQFWIEKTDIGRALPRVWLKLERVANEKEELNKKWLEEDGVLKNMLILRQPAGTNFKLTSQEAERFTRIWSRAGQPWTRSESLAGLWAYSECYGHEVSKSPQSPVGIVSSITGRAVSGVYNKVMNFRNIDSRDPREGLSGASMVDRGIWSEFFDLPRQMLDNGAISAEFERAWAPHREMRRRMQLMTLLHSKYSMVKSTSSCKRGLRNFW
jgi:hypothetical protein